MPTPTPIQPTPTHTSTVTPTFTATATETPPVPTQPALVVDPRTGQLVVPPFSPPTGQVTPVGTAIPGASSLPGGTLPSTGALAGPLVPPSGAPAAGPTVSPRWGCDGDERITFVPPEPKLGETIRIFVTAARPREFAVLLGPQTTTVAGQAAPGGAGLKLQWLVTPTTAGVFTYQFYSGPYPEHLCVTESVQVLGPATATPTSTSIPLGTPTPLPPPRPDH